MIYLSGSKFMMVFKISLLKKSIINTVLSIFIALVLNSFMMDFQIIKFSLSLWNLFMILLITRYFIYNEGFNVKILSFVFTYIIVINIQLYLNTYLWIISILFLTLISIFGIRKVLNTHFDFDKSFNDMVFINRIAYLARGNLIEDTQAFVRETLVNKNRRRHILKNINLKNPLIQKNLITFSRINLFISFYIFAIFTTILILYKFEIFRFSKTIKELGIGIPLVVFHQALLISNIINLITDQKRLLLVKSKEGLYLPYQNMK